MKSLNMKILISSVCFLLVIGVFTSSCNKFVEVTPPTTSLSSVDVYSTDATAIAAVTGIYSSISNSSPFGAQLPGMSGLGGLSADELTLYGGVAGSPLNLYYINNLNNNDGLDFWSSIYPIIYMANAAEEGLNSAGGLSTPVKEQLLGEVEFDRAFCYFYLVNLYGDVPLVLTTNYSKNATLPRTPQAQVWSQIIQDLHSAIQVLSPNYLDETLLNIAPTRVRPIKWAALALLARAYLYTSNWVGADSAASAIINQRNLYRLNSLDSVFLMNSDEAIWQLQPVVPGFNTPEAQAFVLPPTGPNVYLNVAYLSNLLVNDFEPNDLRKVRWVDSITIGSVCYYYPYKYKSDSLNAPITEYSMVLRLGEEYLIRAEAEAHLNNLANATSDLDTIRSRAGLMPINAITQQGVLNSIIQERRIELFSEWGHRWLDLKRTNTIDSVMGLGGVCASKGGVWSTNAQWYPIPISELQSDPNLTQNTGY